MEYFKGQTTRERAVGYCHNSKHKGYLSIKNLKQHKCLGKKCHYLEKYLDRAFWIERERIKAEKKARKKHG